MTAVRLASRRPRRGFTLIEASLAMVIVGVGLVSMLELIAAGTSANVDGVNETAAMNLAKNVRERTLKLTFAQVRALDGSELSPPVDGRGIPIAGLEEWTQSIDVQAVDPTDLKFDIVNPDPDAVRVTVRISRNGEHVCRTFWYRFRPAP